MQQIINTAAKVGRPKSNEKRQQIMRAATELFLQKGFTATSMNVVSTQARVSKQTVYSHFANKDALFSACIQAKCEQYALKMAALESQHLSARQWLIEVGLQMIELLHDPQVIDSYRVVIAESKTTPHVAKVYYQAGPQRACKMIACGLQQVMNPTLNDEPALELAKLFLNLLRDEFHLLSLMGLPFALTVKEQRQHSEKCADRLLKLSSL